MIGPLDRDYVVEMIARGEVSEHDLAQRDGIEVWVPLRRLFPSPKNPSRIQQARRLAGVWGLKFWTALHFDPLRVGLASLLLGCTLIIFPQWTFLLFVPALASAVFAGAILLTRGRFVSGFLLSAGALVFPALLLLAARDRANFGSAIQLYAAPSIESVVPPMPVVPAKPTPRPSLRGVALPEPVRAPEPPRPAPPI